MLAGENLLRMARLSVATGQCNACGESVRGASGLGNSLRRTPRAPEIRADRRASGWNRSSRMQHRPPERSSAITAQLFTSLSTVLPRWSKGPFSVHLNLEGLGNEQQKIPIAAATRGFPDQQGGCRPRAPERTGPPPLALTYAC